MSHEPLSSPRRLCMFCKNLHQECWNCRTWKRRTRNIRKIDTAERCETGSNEKMILSVLRFKSLEFYLCDIFSCSAFSVRPLHRLSSSNSLLVISYTVYVVFWILQRYSVALSCLPNIGVDLAGILGDALRAPKVGWCRVGWCMGKGVPSAAD